MFNLNPTPWIGPRGQIMRRLELHLTYTCPERCIFCSEDTRMQAYKPYPVTWGRVATVLRTHAKRGVTNLHLTGGEPTIHPRFVDVLALAKKLGMRTSVGTIGTMLAKREFAEKALPFLDEALFSLHGPDAETHDGLTRRSGSFEQVVQAIRLSQEIKPDFGAFVNTVITRHNIDVLGDTVKFANQLGAKLIVISNTTPEGAAQEKYPDLAIPLTKLAEVLPTIPAQSEHALIRYFGVPMCLLGEHHTYSNDLHWDPRVTVEWTSVPGKVVFDGLYSWTPARRRIHPPECADCTLTNICMGVFDDYAALWPTDALRPVTNASAPTIANEL